MQVVSPELISGKKLLLRLDIDVAIENGKVVEDFRLKAGLPTLRLCLEHASEVIIIGHIGRPGGKEDAALSVAPIYSWLESQEDLRSYLESGKLKLLENLRFEPGEDKADLEYAKQLASLGEVFINESFATYREVASTTVLPTLLPSFAGLRFAEEVQKLKEVRDSPKKPLVVIMGGAKVEDKLPVVMEMSKIADYVLVGGKIASEIQNSKFKIQNTLVAKLNEAGTDITQETVEEWMPIIAQAKMIVWNGPLGKTENDQFTIYNLQNLESAQGTYEIASMIIESQAESIVGGGDTITALDKWGLLEKFNFVSTGGGAMLKFLETGTLPTIEVLK